MNLTNIKSMFTLFSGNADVEECEPVIELAVIEVENMILESADKNDARLDYLCAAIANFRYYQAMTAQNRSAYTYGGRLIDDSDGKILGFAEGLLKGYFRLCSDIIKGSDFVFIGAA